MQRAFFDVRITVTHLNAPSHRNKSAESVLKVNVDEKKRAYNSRILEVEHGTFTPLVFATNGIMSKECVRFHKILADKISVKSNHSYTDTINYIRQKLSYSILKSAIISLRGNRSSKKTSGTVTIAETNFNFF